MPRCGRPGVPVFELGEAADDAPEASPRRVPASPHASAVRDFEGVFDLVADGAAPEPRARSGEAQQRQPGARGPRRGREGGQRRPSPGRPWGSWALRHGAAKLLLPLCCLCLVLVCAFVPRRHTPTSGDGQFSLMPVASSDIISDDRLSAVLPIIIVGGGFFCMALGALVASCVWWLVQQDRLERETADSALHEDYASSQVGDRELFTINEFVQKLQSKLGLTVTEEQLGKVCMSLRKNCRGAISATALLQECLSMYGEELRAKRP